MDSAAEATQEPSKAEYLSEDTDKQDEDRDDGVEKQSGQEAEVAMGEVETGKVGKDCEATCSSEGSGGGGGERDAAGGEEEEEEEEEEGVGREETGVEGELNDREQGEEANAGEAQEEAGEGGGGGESGTREERTSESAARKPDQTGNGDSENEAEGSIENESGEKEGQKSETMHVEEVTARESDKVHVHSTSEAKEMTTVVQPETAVEEETATVEGAQTESMQTVEGAGDMEIDQELQDGGEEGRMNVEKEVKESPTPEAEERGIDGATELSQLPQVVNGTGPSQSPDGGADTTEEVEEVPMETDGEHVATIANDAPLIKAGSPEQEAREATAPAVGASVPPAEPETSPPPPSPRSLPVETTSPDTMAPVMSLPTAASPPSLQDSLAEQEHTHSDPVVAETDRAKQEIETQTLQSPLQETHQKETENSVSADMRPAVESAEGALPVESASSYSAVSVPSLQATMEAPLRGETSAGAQEDLSATDSGAREDLPVTDSGAREDLPATDSGAVEPMEVDPVDNEEVVPVEAAADVMSATATERRPPTEDVASSATEVEEASMDDDVVQVDRGTETPPSGDAATEVVAPPSQLSLTDQQTSTQSVGVNTKAVAPEQQAAQQISPTEPAELVQGGAKSPSETLEDTSPTATHAPDDFATISLPSTVQQPPQRRASDPAVPLTQTLEQTAQTTQTQSHLIVHEATQTTQTPPSNHGTTPTLKTTPTTRDPFANIRKSTPAKPTQTVHAHVETPPAKSKTTPTQASHPHTEILAQAVALSGLDGRHTSKKSETTQSMTLTASTGTQRATSAAELATPPQSASQFAGFQPLIQVTPSGTIMTLVPTAQLQMAASLQIQHAAEKSARKKAASSPVKVTESGAIKFGSAAKKQRSVVQPEPWRAAVLPQVSVQKMSVPNAQTFESTQLSNFQLEPIEIQAVMSQTELTKTSPQSDSGKPPHQAHTPGSSPQLDPTKSASQLMLVQDTSTNLSATGTALVSAPVAHVPVVQRAGSAEERGEREAGTEVVDMEMQTGAKSAEKLMVQKAEILGAGVEFFTCTCIFLLQYMSM